MWHGHTISVIFPTYNERDSIYNEIRACLATGCVDEVVVVNNNAAPGTSEEVARTSAREVFEPRQGYGFAIQRGLREAQGDYLVISEPDGTFKQQDVFKLLAYADDFDIVLGTRTARELIWKGANMGAFLRWGNWAVAKLTEFLFNTTNLTDVGCTLRLIKREHLTRIQPHFRVGGSHFGPEMMVLSAIAGLRLIQIPVNYKPRVGHSAVTGDLRKALILGCRMILMILRLRLMSYMGRVRIDPPIDEPPPRPLP
ncbi:MAG: glycosyltransferase family 2 protein [Chloroflexi bacterium]|nr:glycosyltransferase family 2 protein [Chloroflexota bacterium]